MRSAKVRDWMSRDVTTVREDESVLTAIQVMQERNIRRLPVVDENDVIIGLITEADVRGLAPFSSRGRPLHDFEAILEEYQVREQMSRNPVTIHPDRDLVDAVRYFLKGKFGALPVLEEDELIGIITITDVMEAFLEHMGVEPARE